MNLSGNKDNYTQQILLLLHVNLCPVALYYVAVLLSRSMAIKFAIIAYGCAWRHVNVTDILYIYKLILLTTVDECVTYASNVGTTWSMIVYLLKLINNIVSFDLFAIIV